MAKFKDISNIVDRKYNVEGYVTNGDKHSKNIEKYISKYKRIKTGDILFVGSSYLSRQYYGFIIVDKREGNNWHGAEKGTNLPFESKSLRDYLISNNIKYGDLFQNLDEHFGYLSGYKYRPDEIENDYKKHGLW